MALLTLIVSAPAQAAQIMVQQVSNLQLDYDRRSAQLAIAAIQRIWLLPGGGGTAAAISPVGLSLREPRFSPSGTQIIATGGWLRGQQHLWLIDVASHAVRQLTDGDWRDTAPTWHPDGEHIVFTSDRGGSRDIWQIDITSGTSVALTRTRGEAFDPTLSADGAQLVFVLEQAGRYSIQRSAPSMGGRSLALVSTGIPLSKPQFRHDGFSLTYQQQLGKQRQLMLLLPVREMFTKSLHGNRLLGESVIAWRDRDHYFTVQDGRIAIRKLAAAGSSQDIPITLWLSARERRDMQTTLGRDNITDAQGRWVLRAQRVLASDGRRYLQHHDVLIQDGRIERIAAAQPWPELNIIDLGDAVVIPGLIDTRNVTDSLVSPVSPLAAGITLQVHDNPMAIVDLTTLQDNRERLQALRATDDPRIIVSDQFFPDALEGAHWITLAGVLAENTHLLTPAQSNLIGRTHLRIPSEMGATAGIPATALETLARSRLFQGHTQARVGTTVSPAIMPALAPWLIAASGESPVAPPLALHAELLTLEHAGLSAADVLATATSQAAAAVGRDDLGVIAVGKAADLVVVTGDPLNNTADLLNTIAVVHRGHFRSVASLIESTETRNVE